MRIVLDARPALDPRRTGVGHYASMLIRHLPLAEPADEIVAWYLHARGILHPKRFFDDVDAPNLHERASRFPARVFGPVSWRLQVPRLESLVGSFDALLATNFVPPPTRSRGVVLVVHDLAYRRFPETAPQIDARWERRFARALRDCAAVIVPSASARADLLASYPLDAGRVRVVPHGVDRFDAPPANVVSDTLQRYGIEPPYVLFVGGIEPRKNLRALVEAFSRVDDGARLVIAGGAVRWFPSGESDLHAAVRALPGDVRDRIVFTGYVQRVDRDALLARATVLAYPSIYEGFGFPVLEAMAAGVPVLTSTASSLPEVAGDAAVLVDPSDREAIADGLDRLLGDGSLRDRLRDAGRARASAFTWDATARATSDVLRLAGSSRG